MPMDQVPGETFRGEAMRVGARLGLILPRLCAYRGCIFSSYFSIPFDPTVEVDGSSLGASFRGAVKRLSQISGNNVLALRFHLRMYNLN